MSYGREKDEKQFLVSVAACMSGGRRKECALCALWCVFMNTVCAAARVLLTPGWRCTQVSGRICMVCMGRKEKLCIEMKRYGFHGEMEASLT